MLASLPINRCCAMHSPSVGPMRPSWLIRLSFVNGWVGFGMQPCAKMLCFFSFISTPLCAKTFSSKLPCQCFSYKIDWFTRLENARNKPQAFPGQTDSQSRKAGGLLIYLLKEIYFLFQVLLLLLSVLPPPERSLPGLPPFRWELQVELLWGRDSFFKY